MNRPFLCLAGEYAVTMPLAFEREAWSHTMSAKRLVVDEGGLHREGVTESLEGVLWYADVDNDAVKTANLRTLITHRVPCWPDPRVLLRLENRHEVMTECLLNGLARGAVVRRCGDESRPPTLPVVVKTGNRHQGEGKYRARTAQEWCAVPAWEGLATLEPFYEGTSCRVLTLGEQTYGLRYDNPDTWIKNAAGAEVDLWPELPRAAFEHAAKVHAHFGLGVSGIDYIIGPGGEVHFLEYNQFPGLGAFDPIREQAALVFRRAMNQVEEAALAAKRR